MENYMDDQLKKLFIHSLLSVDPEEKYAPMTLREEKELLNRFSEKEVPDSINFAIIKEREEPGKVFSQKALERFLHTIRLFIGGRIMAEFDKTQKCPEVTVVNIRIEHTTKKDWEERTNE
jgi:hypothetical protein